MKPTILSGAQAGTGQTYQDPRDRIAARGVPTKPIPQAKPKPKKRETYIIEIEDGGSKYEVEWTGEAPPDKQAIQNLIGRTRQAEGRVEGQYQDKGATAPVPQANAPKAATDKPMRLSAKPSLLDIMGYGVQAIKEGFGEQVRGDLETVAELDKTIGKPLADGRKFVGDVAGTILDPYMKAKPADQFSEGRAVSKGIQSLDPTQMLSAAKPALEAKGGTGGGQPLINSVMGWIANPVPGTVKFLSGVDDETVQKAIAGDVGAMESLVGGALAFASNFVGAKTVKDAFASGNAKKISNVLDKASKVAVSRGDESVNGLGAIKPKPVKGATLPDKAKGMGWRDPADVDPIVSFIRGDNVTNVTGDMPGVEFRTNTRMGEVTPGHREAARLTGKPLTTNDTAGLDMSMTMLDKAMRKMGLPDEQVRGTLAALNPILEQNPGAIFKVVDQIDPTGKLKQEYAAPFYSKLEQVAQSKLPNRATPDQIRKTLLAAGVKPEEMQWTRMDDILSGETVTKQDILDHLQENQVRVEEVMKGAGSAEEARLKKLFTEKYGERFGDHLTVAEASDYERAVKFGSDSRADKTKFGKYTLPGGKEYRELLLTYDPPRPHRKALNKFYDEHPEGGAPDHMLDAEDAESYRAGFTGSHWDEPNVLAHIRFDTRKGPKGERVLHVAEIQSDWHQKGRKEGYATEPLPSYRVASTRYGWSVDPAKPVDAWGHQWGSGDGVLMHKADAEALLARLQEAEPDAGYVIRQNHTNDPRVPDAPFKGNAWKELAMKRIMRYAAENDFDRVSWDTGATNADRYDLSKQVSELRYRKSDQTLQAWKSDIDPNQYQEPIIEQVATPDKLSDLVGKDMAQKIMATEPGSDGWVSIKGEGLKVGGEGMKGFYDRELPNIASKMGKRFGAKVEPHNIATDAPGEIFKDASSGRYFIERDGVMDTDRTFATRAEAESAIGNGSPSHSMAITPEMKAALLNEGQPLFQTGADGIKGAYSPSSRVIELAQGKADVSTVIHEVAHDWHGFLKDHPEHGPIIRKHYGDMTDEAGAEAFARHFERFLMTGKSPVAGLQRVFEAVRDWMKQIYTKWTHGKAPAEVEAIFKKAYQNPSERTMKLAREFEEAIGKKGQPDPLAPDAMTAAKDPDFYTDGGGGAGDAGVPGKGVTDKPKGPFGKGLAFLDSAFATLREGVATGDLSFPGIQGSLAALTDTKAWMSGLKTSVASYAKLPYEQAMAKIAADVDFEKIKATGVDLPGVGGATDEVFQNSPLQKAPLGIGKAVKASARSYDGGATATRYYMVKSHIAMAEALNGGKPLSKESLKVIGDAVNTMTGRASSGLGRAVRGVDFGRGLFAPSYWVSLFEAGFGKPLLQSIDHGKTTGEWGAAKLYARKSLRGIAAATSVLATAKIALESTTDWKVELDPRSPLGGKAYKVLNGELSSVDLLPPQIGQPWRFLAIFAGGKKGLDGKIDKSMHGRMQAWQSLLEGKMAPGPKLGLNIRDSMLNNDDKAERRAAGKDVDPKTGYPFGKDYDPREGEGLKNLGLGSIPISVQQMKEMYESKSLTWEEKVALVPFLILSRGPSSYPKDAKDTKKDYQTPLDKLLQLKNPF